MIFLIDIIKKNIVIFSFVLIGIILTIILMLGGAFNRELIFSRTSLPSGQTEILDNTTPIVFYFSEELDPKTIVVKISPETKFLIKTGVESEQGTLSVYPLPWWKYKTPYTITVDKKLLEKQGGRLKSDISFSFSLIFPNNNPTLFQQPGPGPYNP